MKNPYKHAFSGVHDFVHKKLSESMVGARVVNTHKGTNREGWEGKVVGGRVQQDQGSIRGLQPVEHPQAGA